MAFLLGVPVISTVVKVVSETEAPKSDAEPGTITAWLYDILNPWLPDLPVGITVDATHIPVSISNNASYLNSTPTVAAAFLFSILAVFLLPSWWEDYVRFKMIGRQKSPEAQARLGLIPYIGAFLAHVLPRSDNRSELDDISMPFLQQQTKDVLRHAVQSFQRVVILVDDADVLTSDQFHQLLRVLRPISKVDGVACLVAVPKYFEEIFSSQELGDAHSTVRHVAFLGNPEMFVPNVKGPFPIRLDNNVGDTRDRLTPLKLRAILTQLMVSRMKIHLSDKDYDTRTDFIRALETNPLFEDLFSNWSLSGNWRSAQKHFINTCDGSFRELIRQIERQAPKKHRISAPDWETERDEAKRQERIELHKQSYEEMEQAFHANADDRLKMRTASKKL